jgi:hypothetical protein
VGGIFFLGGLGGESCGLSPDFQFSVNVRRKATQRHLHPEHVN